MICPKCFTVEKEDGLKCHKCGAQLQTGIFRQPLPPSREVGPPDESGGRFSRRTNVIVIGVLLVAALALLVILAMLDAPA